MRCLRITKIQKQRLMDTQPHKSWLVTWFNVTYDTNAFMCMYGTWTFFIVQYGRQGYLRYRRSLPSRFISFNLNESQLQLGSNVWWEQCELDKTIACDDERYVACLSKKCFRTGKHRPTPKPTLCSQSFESRGKSIKILRFSIFFKVFFILAGHKT